VDTKASLRGIQIGVRDLRLASNAADIQKANDYIPTRLKSVDHFVDEMLKLSKSAENRARIEKLKTRASDYSKGAQQISAVRAEIVAAAGATDAAARIAKLNEEALRIAREVTLPIAAEIEPLANQIADFAKHGVEEQAAQAASEMATAEWESMALGIGTILLLIATSIFSFFTIARPMRALSVSMDELAGGNFAVVLPGLGRSSARSPALSRNSRSCLGAEGPRGGGSQDQAGPDRGATAQGRDGQARRFLRGRRRRDRRDRVIRFKRTRSVRRHADVDRRARVGSHDHGCGGFGRSDHQRAIGCFGDGGTVLLGQ